MTIKFQGNKDKSFMFCQVDLEHHSKVFGTASKGVDTSPVGMVQRGIYPLSYLEVFPSDSMFFDAIELYKTTKELQ